MTKTIQLHTKSTRKDKHEVTKAEVMDAIDYFHTMGFIEEMRYDPQHYVKILLKKVANDYNMLLEDENGQLI